MRSGVRWGWMCVVVGACTVASDPTDTTDATDTTDTQDTTDSTESPSDTEDSGTTDSDTGGDEQVDPYGPLGAPSFDTDWTVDSPDTGMIQGFVPVRFSFTFQFGVSSTGQTMSVTSGNSTYDSFVEVEFEDAAGDTCAFHWLIAPGSRPDALVSFLSTTGLRGGLAVLPNGYTFDGGFDKDGGPCELNRSVPFASDVETLFLADDDGFTSRMLTGVAAAPGPRATAAIAEAIAGGASIDPDVMTGGLFRLPFLLEDEDGNTFHDVECLYEGLVVDLDQELVQSGNGFEHLTRAQMATGGQLRRGFYLGLALPTIELRGVSAP